MNRRNFLRHLISFSLLPFFQRAGLITLASGLASCQPQKSVATENTFPDSSSTPPAATQGIPPTPPPTPTNTPQITISVSDTPTPAPLRAVTFGNRVIHIHHKDATQWRGEKRYWEYVNQQSVNEMVDKGITELTESSTVEEGWRKLLPHYQPGEGIAIKLNFNNTIWENCAEESGQINALPQPVNAVITGLKSIGVQEEDIWLYDGVNRIIPQYFIAGINFPAIRYFDRCHEPVTYESRDSSAFVAFSPPIGVQMPTPQKIADVLLKARYLINMPILKSHGCSSVTLGFKNHLGSIDNPGGLHSHIFLVSACGGGFTPQYSPLVDLYLNPHIRDKTILIIGDGLFGGKGSEDTFPSSWSTFGNHVPNSLFFSTDPVAMDSVMADFLRAEPGAGVMSQADNYLFLAEQAGLGKAERGEPWGKGYQRILYHKIEG